MLAPMFLFGATFGGQLGNAMDCHFSQLCTATQRRWRCTRRPFGDVVSLVGFVEGAGPGCWVVQVEAAGAIQGVLGPAKVPMSRPNQR
ncbi:hypothetical protein EFY87_03800 [Flexivirga caeni]|uniref:Uncharacterized protein n=1 Tax=Flexivirga caeni TaxID=2294115 RepID=A0A3M9MI05_9MICO|nr:hypothetical protein EFY87_03800 [Flexivirga caeni]